MGNATHFESRCITKLAAKQLGYNLFSVVLRIDFSVAIFFLNYNLNFVYSYTHLYIEGQSVNGFFC